MTQPGLIVIDVQNDFCEGGALEVPLGSTIVDDINVLLSKHDIVVLSQDWHPQDHRSFAVNHNGKQPYDTYDAPYGTQVLWPAHCVQGSAGADFHPRLKTEGAQLIVRKGFQREIDSYSVFLKMTEQRRRVCTVIYRKGQLRP